MVLSSRWYCRAGCAGFQNAGGLLRTGRYFDRVLTIGRQVTALAEMGPVFCGDHAQARSATSRFCLLFPATVILRLHERTVTRPFLEQSLELGQVPRRAPLGGDHAGAELHQPACSTIL